MEGIILKCPNFYMLQYIAKSYAYDNETLKHRKVVECQFGTLTSIKWKIFSRRILLEQLFEPWHVISNNVAF